MGPSKGCGGATGDATVDRGTTLTSVYKGGFPPGMGLPLMKQPGYLARRRKRKGKEKGNVQHSGTVPGNLGTTMSRPSFSGPVPPADAICPFSPTHALELVSITQPLTPSPSAPPPPQTTKAL
ncbi:unnamed protein product [Boreogadus saida]